MRVGVTPKRGASSQKICMRFAIYFGGGEKMVGWNAPPTGKELIKKSHSPPRCRMQETKTGRRRWDGMAKDMGRRRRRTTGHDVPKHLEALRLKRIVNMQMEHKHLHIWDKIQLRRNYQIKSKPHRDIFIQFKKQGILKDSMICIFLNVGFQKEYTYFLKSILIKYLRA